MKTFKKDYSSLRELFAKQSNSSQPISISGIILLLNNLTSHELHNFTFYQASLTDLADLLTLERICFQSDIISKQSMRNFLKKSSAEIFAVKNTNQLIIASAILLYRKKSNKARLYSFAVHPDFRREGVAAQLLSYCEERAWTHNASEMILEVREDNLPAIHFYKKHKYEIFGTFENFYDDGTRALRMRKHDSTK